MSAATINGWALTGTRSHRVHAVPMPTDLGGHGRAICGKRPSVRSGWLERPVDAPRVECRDYRRATA